MIIIAKTIKDIDKLINKAEYFLDKSIEYKTIYPSLSETYYKTHSELLNTVNNLHSNIVDFIKEQKDKNSINKDILDVMMKIWNFEPQQYIERIEYLESKENKYKMS